MRRINSSVLSSLSSDRNSVVGVMLISAVFITIVRLLGPLTIYWDMSIQLEAAHRLVEGLGLTHLVSSHFDLNQPPIAEPLTHFPPGLSILVAAFLALKVPLAIALKIIYGSVTIAGWIGWSIISSFCLSYPLALGSKLLPVNIILAAALPIFYTPPWTAQGTDILLWAGTPWVGLLLMLSRRYPLWILPTAVSGVLLAGLLSFRYASGFLLLAVPLITFYVSLPSVKSFLFRCSAFFLAFGTPFLLTSLYAAANTESNVSSTLTQALQSHGARYASSNLALLISGSVEKITASFSNLHALAGLQISAVEFLQRNYPLLNNIIGLIYSAFIVSLLIALFKYRRQHGAFLGRDISVLLTCLLISFILFSAALTFFIAYSPLEIYRYYFPVQVCFLLLAYRVATLAGFNRFLQWAIKLIIIASLSINVVLKPAYYAFEDGSIGLLSTMIGEPRSRLLDLSNMSYPSNDLLTGHTESLDFLIAAEQQAPDALFFIQAYPEYMSYAKFENPSMFRMIPDSWFWEEAYLSKATKIFWIIKNLDCPTICASQGNFNSDDPAKPISSLLSLENVTTLFANKEARILVSDLPADYKFADATNPAAQRSTLNLN